MEGTGCTTESSTLDRVLAGLVDNLGDPRVAAALAGPLASDLKLFVHKGLVDSFTTAATTLEVPFEGFPDSVTSSADVGEAVASYVESELGQHQQTLAVAIAGLIGDFIVAGRGQVIDAMNAAGEGPAGGRNERVASAAEAIAQARAKVPGIDAAADIGNAESLMEEIRDALEGVRETLGAQLMDDAIVWGSRPDADAGAPDGRPALTRGGRREDVESLMFESWMLEMDMQLMLAARVGGPVKGDCVAPEEQREFVLDALVAIQEAYTLRQLPEVLLKFGELRLAKGDVGEARMAAQKVMEMVEDEESPIHVRAEALFDAVTEASPLTRRDKRCFIATAAMGDIDASEVECLRAFRDDVLMKYAFGRAFVRFYYRASPGLAGLISERPVLRSLVRDGFVVPMAEIVSSFSRRGGSGRGSCGRG